MSKLTRNYLYKEYTTKQRSTYDIAEANHTYANKIRRLLLKYNIPLRDKSQAQSVALEQGRHTHPTKGQHRPNEVKIQISESMAQVWKNMHPDELLRRKELAKTQWNNMSLEDKRVFKKLAAQAVRKASKDGSKLEQYLLFGLRRAKFKVEFHRGGLVINEKLEIDLFLPDLKTAIEVDGPAHFFPIWGQKSLERHLKADNQKTGLLIMNGFNLIRIKHLNKTTSEVQKRNLLKQVLSSLKEIGTHSAGKLIEIEIK